MKLKQTVKLLGVILLGFSMFLSGCKKYPDETMHEVKFNISAHTVEKPKTNNSKSRDMFVLFEEYAINPEEVTHIQIGVGGTHTTPMYSEIQPFSLTNGAGVTNGMKLPTGNHTLTSLTLLKETAPEVYEVLYSAVNSESFLSQFIVNVLPISFQVPLLDNVPVNVDVIAVDDWTPQDFGWALFNIGITTIYPLYFYGADDAGQQSDMLMQIYSGNKLISTSTTETQGWIKIYFPDYGSIINENEVYLFKLFKDGIEYQREWSVAELLTLPKEVHLLNVYGSGMMGFVEIVYLNSGTFSMPNVYAPNNSEMFGFEVINSSGVIVFSSEVTAGPKSFQYVDTGTLDYNEYFTIRLNYRLYNVGPGTYGDVQTRTAYVNVTTLKNMASSIEMGVYSNNYWWLFI